MIETILGIIIGGVVSWLLTHWYYRKSKNDAESKDPIPLLISLGREVDGIKANLQERSIHSSVDDELDASIERISEVVTELKLRIANAYLPLDITIQGILFAKEKQNWDAVQKLLDDVDEYRQIAIKELFAPEGAISEVGEAFKKVTEQMDALDGHSAALQGRK